MTAKTIMIQGTASSVGKSIMVAALCRIFNQDGFRVAPFKAQNMSNNSFVTTEGGEIGRAQAVQAEAAGIVPSVYMNPVLLKPEADNRSQVVVLGKVNRTVDARNYYKYTPNLIEVIRDSLEYLQSRYDIVVIEGAGSPAEINLKDREIVNMRVAKMVNSPVLLVGDIDRGGVFASIIGTLDLLDNIERKLIKGFIINKFRGEKKLLAPGLAILAKRTNLPVLGVIPFFKDINIAQEDAVFLEDNHSLSDKGDLNIAVIHLPRVSNYDDFDPLEKLGCNVTYTSEPRALEKADLIIIPGTKSTMADLQFMRTRGLDKVILRKAAVGTWILGICGGYQMMGKSISDPQKTESEKTSLPGLGMLDMQTVFTAKKTTTQVEAEVVADYGIFQGLQGTNIRGYEIHLGHSQHLEHKPVFEIIKPKPVSKKIFDGSISKDGNIAGTYIHGMFHNTDFCRNFVNRLRLLKNMPVSHHTPLNLVEEYDKLANIVRANLALEDIYKIVLEGKTKCPLNSIRA